MRYISILGSTGSIGRQAIDVLKNDPDMRIVALSCNKDILTLKSQVELLHPDFVTVFDEEKAEEFKKFSLPTEVYTGIEGLKKIASLPTVTDVLVSVVGMIGIEPTIEAIKAGKTVELANKETLCCAGHIIMPLAKEMNKPIRPVDSEHSAIWQSLYAEDRGKIKKIILTCSGGPFRGLKREELSAKTKFDALKHPSWNMGQKITIDSATLVNKGLEVLEASWLFDVPVDMIKVVVHPESIVHSAVEYVDGAVKAELSVPDMRIPIEYAFYHPSRHETKAAELDFFSMKLSFEQPDTETFKGLKLGIEAGTIGGSMPVVYNAANEEAVKMFLDEKISFLDISDSIEKAMIKHKDNLIKDPDLEEILETEKWARSFVKNLFKG